MGTLIREKLWLGGASDAYDLKKLKEQGTTHVLTVELSPLREDHRQEFVYLFVNAEDSAEENLLDRFDECFEFIEQGRAHKTGGVLVHCFMGYSRSATVVISYLMRKEGLSLKEAMDSVMRKRSVGPNPGFMQQLRMFEKMGAKIDQNHPDYRSFSLEKLTAKVREVSFGRKKATSFAEEASITGPAMDRALAADPMLTALSKDDSCGSDNTLFRCRKCRRPLARASSLLPHSSGRGKAFGALSPALHRSVNGRDDEAVICLEGYFFEPVEWMRDQILFLEGKLQCPKESCQAKLGNFNWVGQPCPCGHWVVPAFHLSAGKVDAPPKASLNSFAALASVFNAQDV